MDMIGRRKPHPRLTNLLVSVSHEKSSNAQTRNDGKGREESNSSDDI